MVTKPRMRISCRDGKPECVKVFRSDGWVLYMFCGDWPDAGSAWTKVLHWLNGGASPYADFYWSLNGASLGLRADVYYAH